MPPAHAHDIFCKRDSTQQATAKQEGHILTCCLACLCHCYSRLNHLGYNYLYRHNPAPYLPTYHPPPTPPAMVAGGFGRDARRGAGRRPNEDRFRRLRCDCLVKPTWRQVYNASDVDAGAADGSCGTNNAGSMGGGAVERYARPY